MTGLVTPQNGRFLVDGQVGDTGPPAEIVPLYQATMDEKSLTEKTKE